MSPIIIYRDSKKGRDAPHYLFRAFFIFSNLKTSFSVIRETVRICYDEITLIS